MSGPTGNRDKNNGNLRPFKKGQSGNPRGRPKVDFTIQELARAHCPKAINHLAAILENPKSSPAAQVSAAIALLDRGYGKPPQFTTGDEMALKRAIEMTDDELATSIEAAKRKLGIGETETDPSQLN
jgi:hypothetical protein